MNRMTPDTPLAETLALLQRDGYVLMENALAPDQLATMSAAYDRQLALHPPAPGATRVEVKRILEQDPVFENTEIWHTNWPNESDQPRRLIMILYKHAWMKQWQEGYETTPEFAARQTDPIRRQLTGSQVWHHGREHFPAAALVP